MKRFVSQNRTLTGLAALLLLGLFGLGTLGVLLQGASAYRALAARDETAQQHRTCIQFLSTKVRQAPSAQSVSLSDFGGGALVIQEELEGQTCLTRIYCHEGWLMELFTVGEGDFRPEDGEKILPLERLSFTLQNGDYLQIFLPEETLTFRLRGEEGWFYAF